MDNIQDEITIELARVEREARARIAAKMASQQLGLAWIDLVDERRPLEGCEVERA